MKKHKTYARWGEAEAEGSRLSGLGWISGYAILYTWGLYSVWVE